MALQRQHDTLFHAKLRSYPQLSKGARMGEFYRLVAERLRQTRRVAAATIVHIRGSVPREAGTKMLIDPAGHHVGTIGGGCGESDVIAAGLRAIDTNAPALVRVDLTEDISLESLGVCGGVMDVLVEPWEDGRLLRRLVEAEERNESLALLHVVAAPPPLADTVGRHALLTLDGRDDDDEWLGAASNDVYQSAAELLDNGRSGLARIPTPEGEVSVYVEVQGRAPRLVIVGAGHIAVPLARLAKQLDFHVTVLDDRPAFANRARFPDADRIVVDYFQPALRDLDLDRQTYIVLVTRGHQHDVESLIAVLDRPTAYIGMIGSARRVRAVFELLEREMGIDPQRLDKVHSPIGLDIGAETPAEIAVAIMAEIVKVRRGGSGVSLTDRERRGPVHTHRHAPRPLTEAD
ncbi:MAG: XdhC family protein [Anaerolineae bacterium]